MIEGGYKAQRLANDVLSAPARKQVAKPPATLGKAPIREQVIHFVNKKMPGGLPKQTARKLLDIEDPDYVPIIRNPAATSPDTERSEEHTSELQSLMRISYAVFCLKKKKKTNRHERNHNKTYSKQKQ